LYKYGPLVAGVDASTWNEYMGGIIQYHCGTSINHAVQIVGYDLTGTSAAPNHSLPVCSERIEKIIRLIICFILVQ